MTRRIACVVFVTLIWGASTDNEEKIRDVFKSNLTRNDFSGLLQSLIKLNERRISVLQKLYRLEDYGVLSEVLRSGGERKEDEDPSNMFLIVMSKNKTNPSLYIGNDGIELLPSLNGSSNKIKPPRKRNARKNIELVKNPAGFIENIRKVISKDIPKFYRPKQINLTDEGSKEIFIIKKPPKHQKTEEKNSNFNLSRALKASRKANNGRRGKENSRFEIVSNNVRLDENHEQQEAKRNNRLPPFLQNDQPKQFPEIDVSLPINSQDIFKYILQSKDKVEDKTPTLSKEINLEQIINDQFTKINSNASVKNDHDNDPITNKDNLKENVKTELNLNKIANKQDNRYNNMKAELVRKLEEKINSKINRDKASEQKQTSNIKHWENEYPKLMKQETNVNISKLEQLALTKIRKHRVKKRNDKNILSLSFKPGESSNGNTDPNITKDSANENLYAINPRKDVRVNPESESPIITKPHEDKQPDEPPIKDGGEKNSETTKINANQFPVFNNGPTNLGRSQPRDNVQPGDPESNDDQTEQNNKPFLRKTYKKQMKRKTTKICTKSCISAYKHVCGRLKCSSRSKKALKRECKRSCRRTFQESGSSSSGASSDDSKHHYWFPKNLH